MALGPFVVVGALLASVSAVEIYQQCDGLTYTGDKTCDAGLVCTFVNDFYSRCIPGSSTGVPIFQQCDGLGYTGQKICMEGLECKYWNPYYSQCLPIPKTSSTTSQASTSITPTSTSQSVSSSTSQSASASATATGLHTLAKAKGKVWFGTAIDNPEINDATYKALISNTADFGQLTPGNALKWDATEGTRNVFTYANANQLVSLAQANGQLIRGHTLVWHSQLPSWVSSGGFDNATLISIIQNHATNVVSQFKGQIYAWDVVNEVLNDDGTFRASVFYNTCGEYFIDAAFIAARAADPAAKLFINDYNIDGTSAKSTAMFNLVQRLKARGVPVDGIGAQAHLIVGSVPGSIATNWAQFASLDVDIHVTELDIRMNLPSDATKLAQQAADYTTVINACLAVSRCTAVTVWGASDKYSWIPSVFNGQGDALPFDASFNKKSAYYAISTALGGPGAPATTVTPTPTVTSTTSTPSATQSEGPGLNVLAKAKGKVWFGTAIDNPEINNASYAALISNTKEFGQLTPGNALKWDATEGTRNVFTYTNANQLVNLAQTNGQLIRGHTLVWHSQLPSWVSNGGFDNATLISIIQNHVTNVVTQYKGKIFAWDVVNEVFNDDGTFRSSVFYNTAGEYFIDAAFIAARAADPDAKLFINDYNIDGTGAKSTAMFNLVQRLQSRGVPVDGIGAQAHLIVGSVPGDIATNWAKFATLNVDIHITELDIRMNLPDNAAKQAQQATDYKNVINACVAVPRCTAITIWGASDKISWVPSVFDGQGDPLPWDADFNKKPAYYAIQAALS